MAEPMKSFAITYSDFSSTWTIVQNIVFEKEAEFFPFHLCKYFKIACWS